jgi:hypothetical protein
VALVTAVALAIPSIAGAGVRPWLSAVVRVYDAYGVGRVDIQAARASLREAFATAGITFTWIDCPSASLNPDPCGDPPARAELVVRFVHSRITRHGDGWALGDALVDETGTGTIVTVYPDEVQRSVGADAASGRLLGLVIAHEIGHLLLGPHAHSKDGLMRPFWSCDEIARESRLDRRLSRPEVVRMRERLSARLAPVPLYEPVSTAAMAGSPRYAANAGQSATNP